MAKAHTYTELRDVVSEQCGELWNARALLKVLLNSWPIEKNNDEWRVVAMIEERLDTIQKAFDPHI